MHVSNSCLQQLRAEFMPKVIKEMKTASSKDYHEGLQNEERRLFHMKSKFLTKFYLYKGVVHNLRASEAGTGGSQVSQKISKEAAASMVQVAFIFSEQSCSPEWPICVFDFTVKSSQASFFVFRTSRLTDFLKEDYFYSTATSLASLPSNFLEEQKQESGGSMVIFSTNAR